jgi:hypothetical protein
MKIITDMRDDKDFKHYTLTLSQYYPNFSDVFHLRKILLKLNLFGCTFFKIGYFLTIMRFVVMALAIITSKGVTTNSNTVRY